MRVEELLENAREALQTLQAKRVYAEPYEQNGVTVIAAASVRGGGGGGGGGGEGPDGKGHGSGGGGGFGLVARPVGAFVIKGDRVTWKPALDVNRLVVGSLLAVAAIVLLGGAPSRRAAR
jgi:uncharacterized spore protein YtfJ